MATKRDQLQSYQFLVQRMVSALVTRETDPEQPPFRRSTAAAIGSVALAVILVAAVGVFGLVSPGGAKSWQSGDVVVVEKETGTRFVYVDGRLHPVTNYVSALLVMGKNAKTRSVSRRSLAGVPRGPLIGIPDAPDALPDRGRLLNEGWTLCAQPATDETGAAVSESVLLVGHQPAAGRPAGEAAMLVTAKETGERYLVWRGHRHRVDPAVTVALGPQPSLPVGTAFVDVLPAGEAVAPIRVAGIGQPSRAVPGRAGTRIGQLFTVRALSGGDQYYLADAERLRPISPVQFDVQRSYAPTATAYQGKAPYGIQLDLASAGRALQQESATAAPEGGLPRERPQFVAGRNGSATVCASFQPGDSVPALLVDPTMPARDPMTATAGRSATGAVLAQRVLVPPGQAALVEVMPSTDTPAGTLAVVTDLGRIHPLGSQEVLGLLGYDGVRPIRIPAGLAARIPQGSALNPQAARAQLGAPGS